MKKFTREAKSFLLLTIKVRTVSFFLLPTELQCLRKKAIKVLLQTLGKCDKVETERNAEQNVTPRTSTKNKSTPEIMIWTPPTNM